MNKIAITMGDPAGIGPEIIIKALNSITINPNNIIIIGNKEIFRQASDKLQIYIDSNINFSDISCDLSQIKTGVSSIESGKISFKCLEKACQLVKNKEVSSIVTAPLAKDAINKAGYHFSGQTEILQKFLGNEKNKAEMLFVSNDLKVLLLTRHVALSKVSQILTPETIIESIIALNNSLKNNFHIDYPKLAICALNPHAGEDGLIGDEEKDIIIPAINILKNTYNIDIEGPFPADTLWTKAGKAFLNKTNQPYDAYIACYHDQGLIPIKLLAMDSTVNTTINLPVLRTSPAHGTAFDIADKYIANPESMKAAIKLALSSITTEFANIQ